MAMIFHKESWENVIFKYLSNLKKKTLKRKLNYNFIQSGKL